MKTLRITAVAVFCSLALIGWCAGAGRAENPDQESVYAELAKAPEKYRNKTNPLANDKDAVAAGKILFEEHCEDCHGTDGSGGRKAPSLRAKEVCWVCLGWVFWILTNGVVRKKMPVWSKLPEPERWQLVSYIKSLGAVEAAEPRGAEHKK